jgi:PAS domain S-box-containing protein
MATTATTPLLRHAERRRLKIGPRLTVSFATIVLLMFASYVLTLWQFSAVRGQEQRIHRLDEESHAVLSLHADLLAMRDRLEDPSLLGDADRFAKEASLLRESFLREVEIANLALWDQRVEHDRDPTTLSTLQAIESSLPAQLDTLTDLARAGDWPAVRLRIDNQVAPLSVLTSQLVEKVDSEVNEERAQAQLTIQHLVKRVFAMHLTAAFLVLVVAILLGTMVTRSITQPLAHLNAGSQALAIGDFKRPVEVEGNDELANLARVFNDATRRLSALYDALRTSEERFRTVVAAAPVGIAVLDCTSTIRLYNSRFLEITGLTAARADGLNLGHPSVAVLKEDGTPCPTSERPSQRAIDSGKPVLNAVMRHLHPVSGEQRWVLVNAWPLLRGDGRVDQVITTLTDITPQKKAEEELRSGRELLAQAQIAGRLGCFDLNLKTNAVVWSAELGDLFGFPPGTLEGRHEDWEALIIPEDLEHARTSVAESIRTGESGSEYRIRRKNDGEIRWVEGRGRVLFDEAGQPQRLIGVTMDITERKRAEDALRRSEEEFHIIFEHSAIGMVLADPSGQILRCNPAFRAILGYSRDERVPLTFAEVTYPDETSSNRSRVQNLIDAKVDRYQVRKRYVRKDGKTCSARVTISGLRGETGELRYSVAMVEDITSQEMAEHRLLLMSKRLLRIQEEEQRRIAREVHDSTSQEITALTLNLGALKAAEHTLPAKARTQIRESLALAKRVAREIRTFSYLLHPPMLNELGLWAALRMFVQEFQ